MSSTHEHHAKAEELLEQARATPDQISRSEILAEAQVHATLALSAAPGTGRLSGGNRERLVVHPEKVSSDPHLPKTPPYPGDEAQNLRQSTGPDAQ